MTIDGARVCRTIVALLALWACSASFAAVPAAADKHSTADFRTGIETLLHDRFDLIRGKHVGLITNPTGVDHELVGDVDLLAHAPGVHLVALFGPEHGIRGAHQAGAGVGSERDPVTGLPVYSLYGKTRQPTPAMLKGVDVLVFDIQAVGARFYTYLYTMADAMKAAAAARIPIIVLDRPDPIGGTAVQGPVLDPKFASFVGEYPIPLRYGMTIGELAGLFNHEFHIGADLTVVQMRGWRRWMYYDDTPLQFVMPSPNMPTETTALVYPGMGLVEGTNVSEGRGTTRRSSCSVRHGSTPNSWRAHSTTDTSPGCDSARSISRPRFQNMKANRATVSRCTSWTATHSIRWSSGSPSLRRSTISIRMSSTSTRPISIA